MIVRKKFTFEAAHRLRAHEGRCAGLHGHSYKVEVFIEGMVCESTGMVVDFGQIKSSLAPFIDQFDHSLIVSEHDPLAHGGKVWYGQIHELNPRFIITPYEPTAEMMAAHFYWSAHYALNVTRVRVWETETGWAECSSLITCHFNRTLFSKACKMLET